ncbi:MAG TPA: M4 family metallopeptidase [Jatrophihabitans sp.]|nr:M4 family metallopeptidase [Jatrophihabitans sp.]
MVPHARRRYGAVISLTGMAAFALAGIAITTTSANAAPPAPAAPSVLAANAAAQLVSSRAAALHASPNDAFIAHSVISTRDGLQYVPYDRTYKGLPVYGGDFVVVTNAAGQVLSTIVAQNSAINLASITPARSAASAASTARGKAAGKVVDGVSAGRQVVFALTATPRLAWETVVSSHAGAIPSKLHVFTDANTGAVLYSYDEVREGTGTGKWNGPNPLAIDTSHPSNYTMTDPIRSGISCRDYDTRAVLSGTDDVWGNGVGSNRETGCVDALFDVQHEWSMLSAWLGRNGINGSGGGYPIYMGLNDVNAFWNGSSVSVGHNNAGDWISELDVLGHEFGHAVDNFTPGGIGSSAVAEFTGDVFGALTEAYANEAAAYDPPDYTVGEEVNLVGTGPIRYMYNPSLAGDPNCYSSSIPSTETHSAAGPGNHWFYLLAEGTNPTDGQPTSPTCNGSSGLVGIGIQTAGKIFYNAMLLKTTSMTYFKYRTATLTAAKNLTPGNCTNFNKVKAAWDAVSVPAQTGDPTCSTTGGVTVTNPGNQTGTVGTAKSLQMTASGGTGSYSWSASGLPTGLSINASSGLISGTPSVAGTFTSTVTATDTASASGSVSFSWTISTTGGGCSSPGQKLGNPGFESGNTIWSSTAGVIGQYGSSGEPTHSGTWDAWMDGYGTTHTDTLSQSVSIPSGCAATFSFYLHIDTSETTTTTAFDKLTVKAGSTTLATYSNLNHATGYSLKSFTVPAGSTSVSFTATEDSSLQTSFVIDDTAFTAS